MTSRDFIWAGGIEDTFIVDAHKKTGKTLEEYELIGHYGRWKEDLEKVASLGITALRWGIPWYRIARTPAAYDWNLADEAVGYMTDVLGIEPIVDLLHYGTPAWLPEGIGDGRFEAAFLEYTARFCERYRGKVRYVTPINEPYTAAEFCGRKGEWPPYGTGDGSFFRLMTTLGRTAVGASKLIASAGFVNVHVEVAGFVLAAEPDLKDAAEDLTLQNYLYWDLILGKIGAGHPLSGRLTASGIQASELAWFEENRADIDILGVNYYPQWSCQLLYRDGRGSVQRRPFNAGPAGLRDLLESMHGKYGLPLMVTETSHRGADWEKAEWLRASLSTIRELRDEGVPVEGFTWFPLIDMIDWEYRNRPGGPEAFLMDLGLFGLDRKENGAAGVYRSLIEEEKHARTR